MKKNNYRKRSVYNPSVFKKQKVRRGVHLIGCRPHIKPPTCLEEKR